VSRGICRRHFYTVARSIGAVVHHIGHRWVEEERQEGSRPHQNDERVQGYFTKQECPVVGENSAAELFDDAGGTHSGVNKVRNLTCAGRSLIILHNGHYAPRSSAGLGSRSQ